MGNQAFLTPACVVQTLEVLANGSFPAYARNKRINNSQKVSNPSHRESLRCRISLRSEVGLAIGVFASSIALVSAIMAVVESLMTD